MEGVFSSLMYASSNQMCKREPSKDGHLLFIIPLNKRVVGHFHWAEIGGTGLTTGSHRTLDPLRSVLWCWPRVNSLNLAR